MNKEKFSRQIESMHGRLQKLYQAANQSPLQQSELMPQALIELGTASEELQVALEELHQQNQELLMMRHELATQRQQYQELFNLAPNAYIQTDVGGLIQKANRAAAILLKVQQEFLIGQRLDKFIATDRFVFRQQLNLLCDKGSLQKQEISLLPYKSAPINIQVTVETVTDYSGKVVALNWLTHNIKNQNSYTQNLKFNECDAVQSRPKQTYSKGEIISLQPQTVWLVIEGLVKLSTLIENGAEVLVGFAGKDMVFGTDLTNLQIYQAIALSKNVQLVSISLPEIEASEHLAINLLPKIKQRLRQTESLLALSGRRRVTERLYYLLLLLKQEIGQPVIGGTRLSVRLTHEDLANACGTTRVTITRVLKKLKQQGKITFDATHHITLLET